ncbi:sigma-70 family RNA polymerase sigma factor [Aquimarina sp. 2201CG5-10]|uniref:RNA polymerase sigma factor n=1 Tax=Aquimarina callyspongiae TaxID=3098150 RepID=UPI002AB3F582|nr:sigma-70 family RNA polymerase sigma factor [Aquimarina sp. 2201CG5-10]MDY8138574.1 sigma-70 family RNA polymerase sigma factor [Aquimarina sp. 2201CG5-10]
MVDLNNNIIIGIGKGDSGILKAFYKKNMPHIRMYILKNSGCEKDVEDVFQDALIIIYQKIHLGTLEISTTIHSYFYAVAKNIWYNQLRKRKKLLFDKRFIELFDRGNNDSIIDKINLKEKYGLYYKYFLQLDTSSRQLLHLFFEGKSTNEISKIMGYTKAYTRKKKFKAKKKLLEMIEKDPAYHELASNHIFLQAVS